MQAFVYEDNEFEVKPFSNLQPSAGVSSFVKQLQQEEADGEVCGYCFCIFSRNAVRQQGHMLSCAIID